MTTTMIVAIAAVAFILVISIVVFVIWKRETEMRTDSMKDIEKRLQDIRKELSEIGYEIHSSQKQMENALMSAAEICKAETNKAEMSKNETGSNAEATKMPAEPEIELPEIEEESPVAEIDLDIIDQLISMGEWDDLDLEGDSEEDLNIYEDVEDIEELKNIIELPSEYITGRSGKKYTAEELETLIKE